MTCPFCGKEHTDDTIFCPMTGKKIEQRVCRNPKCDYRQPLPPYAKFCPSCGSNLDDSPHTTAAPVAKVPRRQPLPADFKPDKNATHIDMSFYDTSRVTDLSLIHI